MNVNDESLSKEELQYLIERLGFPEDELADASDTLLGTSTADQAALQADLKMRLQRGIEEMRARKEEVPGRLLKLIERL
jgi:FixJ family two-component response regulator